LLTVFATKLALKTFSPLSRSYSILNPTGDNRTVEVWAARQRRLTNIWQSKAAALPFFHRY
jgi:hypothetical protein